jgi:hypothetical protein
MGQYYLLSAHLGRIISAFSMPLSPDGLSR